MTQMTMKTQSKLPKSRKNEYLHIHLVTLLSPSIITQMNTIEEHKLSSDESLKVTSMKSHSDLVSQCYEAVKSKLLIKPPIMIFGKICNQQRDVGFFSDVSKGYNYSNQTMKSQVLTPELENLIDFVNEEMGSDCNGILINRYNSGSDYIGAHSDDESGLSGNNEVFAITFYPDGKSQNPRIFRVREKSSKSILVDVKINHLEGVLMSGKNFQKKYTHEVPKMTRCKDVRVSFTFRKHSV
jgi:alkylated DNA repair dioxygenase AlkB